MLRQRPNLAPGGVLSGEYDEINERKESLRDLGVQLTDDGTFGEQIEKVCKKVAGCFELSTQETLNS